MSAKGVSPGNAFHFIARFSPSQRHHAQPIPIRQGDRLGFVEKDGLVRLRSPARGRRLCAGFRWFAGRWWGRRSAGLAGAWRPSRPRSRPTAQLARAGDGPIGAFDGFDRQGRAFLDGHALADVEPAHFLGQFPAEGRCLPVRGRWADGASEFLVSRAAPDKSRGPRRSAGRTWRNRRSNRATANRRDCRGGFGGTSSGSCAGRASARKFGTGCR